MALFGESSNANNARPTPPPSADAARDAAARAASEAAAESRRARERTDAVVKESLIAAELAIEGRIQGSGNVRIAGRFKGDVNVDGNVTIEPGSRLEGAVTAKSVVVAGELVGNVDKAKHVDVLQTGVVVGDIKADTVSVASGARMRGHVEFGSAEAAAPRAVPSPGAASAPSPASMPTPLKEAARG